MNTEKIVGIIGVAVAIVGAFVAIPQMATVLLVAGLIVGVFVIGDHHVRVMVTDATPVAWSWKLSVTLAISGSKGARGSEQLGARRMPSARMAGRRPIDWKRMVVSLDVMNP